MDLKPESTSICGGTRDQADTGRCVGESGAADHVTTLPSSEQALTKNGPFYNVTNHTGTGHWTKDMNPVEGGRRTSKDEIPPATPPPRPPPPRKPPNVREMREKEKILRRMYSMPAYPRSECPSSGERVADRQMSVSGEISLDQVNTADQVNTVDQVNTKNTERSEAARKDRRSHCDVNECTIMQALKLSDPPKTTENMRKTPRKGAAMNDSSSRIEPTSRNERGSRNEYPSRNEPTTRSAKNPDSSKITNVTQGNSVNSTDTKPKPEGGKRPPAPMFSTTKRRSSTVDELLFDDYVEPEDSNVDGTFSQENVPSDLMSFDQDAPDLSSPASAESSEAEYGDAVVRRSESQGSDKSWSSSYSLDSQPDEVTVECVEFMKTFVHKIFDTSEETTQMEKAKFGELCQYAPGRLWFSRYLNSQRVNNKQVGEESFFRLVQYIAVCLFECNEAEDFSPAKTLMNMCFTFYCNMPSGADEDKSFLYLFLKDQPIWQSLRFWNAAFFDAVQCERSRRPTATNSAANDAMTDDRNFQENITFGQLGTFSSNMRSFGLSRELCLEFLRKQSTIANLSKEQVKLLRDNINKMKE